MGGKFKKSNSQFNPAGHPMNMRAICQKELKIDFSQWTFHNATDDKALCVDSVNSGGRTALRGPPRGRRIWRTRGLCYNLGMMIDPSSRMNRRRFAAGAGDISRLPRELLADGACLG